MGQDRDEGSALGDEFDEIRARVDRIRREAQQRIEALRDPTGLDVRLPPRPGSRPAPRDPGPPRIGARRRDDAPPATPVAPLAPTPAPAAAEPSIPDRPVPPRDWRDRADGATTQGPAAPPAPAPVPAPAPAPAPEPPPAPEPVLAPQPTPAPESAPAAEAPPSPAGRTIPVDELPPAGGGWDESLFDVDEGRAGRTVASDPDLVRPGPLSALRDAIERIATSRSALVPVWQAASVVVLVAALLWAVWFPLVAGGGAQALVAADDRMLPTFGRGAVVVIAPSSDLPYPLDAVVALDAGGVIVVERVVDERLDGDTRLLITRADGVSVGPNREVRPEQVIGGVRRIHPVLGYPALWFDEPEALLWRIGLILVLLASAVGVASLIVRAELRRQDRLLVSAIASGDRTPRRR